MRVETSPEPVRDRFAYVSDDESDTMFSLYAPASAEGLGLVDDDTDSARTDKAGPEAAA